jgi:hypothetical protein
MSTSKSIALTFAFLLFASSSPLSAQEPTTRAKTDRSNLEVQVHLLVASSDAAAKDTVPQALQPFVRELRQSLPAANYILAGTYTSRMKAGSTIENKGMVAAKLLMGQEYSGVASFYEYTMTVALATDGPVPTVEIPRFRFGLQLPLFSGMNPPKYDYHFTGITTELSLREATPTLAGTMTTIIPNQMLIVVISVRRTQ